MYGDTKETFLKYICGTKSPLSTGGQIQPFHNSLEAIKITLATSKSA